MDTFFESFLILIPGCNNKMSLNEEYAIPFVDVAQNMENDMNIRLIEYGEREEGKVLVNEEMEEALEFVEAKYDSWSDFHEAVKVLEDRFHHPFRKRNTKTLKSYNDVRRATRDKRKSSQRTPLMLADDSIGNYSELYLCTHGIQRSSRGKGLRNTPCRFLECKAELFAKVIPTEDPFVYSIQVVRCNLEHSHNIGHQWINSLPEKRVLQLNNMESKVALKNGCNNRRVRNNACGPQRYLSMRDVHNWKRRCIEETRPDTFKQYLESFCKKERGNAVDVATDIDEVVQTLSLQTKMMTNFMYQYPEVLIMDATFNTNRNKYALYGFVVMDAWGKGQAVQYSFTNGHSSARVQEFCNFFKQRNPCWSRTRVVIVDKDFAEISVLSTEFPNAKVLLCIFHVIKCFNTQISNSTKYNIPHTIRPILKGLLHMIVYAKDGNEYDQLRKQIKDNSSSEFDNYFTSNWDNCKDMWVKYERDKHTHLGNNTSNRIESHWNQLKIDINPSMTLQSTTEELLHCRFMFENEFALRRLQADTLTQPVGRYPPELRHITSTVSLYVLHLLDSEVQSMHKNKMNYRLDEFRGVISNSFSGTSYNFIYHENTIQCTCSFSSVFVLPCRHVFFIKETVQEECITHMDIPARWCIKNWVLHNKVDSNSHPTSQLKYHSEKKEMEHTMAMSSKMKYNAIMKVVEEYASNCSTVGQCEFERRKRILQIFIGEQQSDKKRRASSASMNDESYDDMIHSYEATLQDSTAMVNDLLSSSYDDNTELAHTNEQVTNEEGTTHFSYENTHNNTGLKKDCTHDNSMLDGLKKVNTHDNTVLDTHKENKPVHGDYNKLINTDEEDTIENKTPTQRCKEEKQGKNKEKMIAIHGDLKLIKTSSNPGRPATDKITSSASEKAIKKSIDPNSVTIMKLINKYETVMPGSKYACHVFQIDTSINLKTKFSFFHIVGKKTRVQKDATKVWRCDVLQKILEAKKQKAIQCHEDKSLKFVKISKVGCFDITLLENMLHYYKCSMKDNAERNQQLMIWVNSMRSYECAMPFNTTMVELAKAIEHHASSIDLKNHYYKDGLEPHKFCRMKEDEWMDCEIIRWFLYFKWSSLNKKLRKDVAILPTVNQVAWRKKRIKEFQNFIKDRSIVIIPLYNDSHFTGSVILRKKGIIIFYDSLGRKLCNESKAYVDYVVSLLQPTWKIKKFNRIFVNSPRQNDGSSCALYTAFYLSQMMKKDNTHEWGKAHPNGLRMYAIKFLMCSMTKPPVHTHMTYNIQISS